MMNHSTLGHRQKAIIAYLQQHETIDVSTAAGLSFYYANGNFHAGNVLRSLVKRGFLKRVKRGVYAPHISRAERAKLPVQADLTNFSLTE